ncbi:Rho guanyl nucleotide exchange factor [Rasamsonia emersonii CBS 393.64]|uniref:Rho guanyl nucleotide exchange factor n=1 Tax=Rasamsonia emersonii (strain ATCC 16479 / CBS 393.64 / IMI 116815) TaxID=1408163 RepID=A0A0F4YP05_RASE3|nr:Rho guanyl nucleotide exchange factor [Rasamsonia emersonii CBS 393.64]KKA19997.1 Rho guanyl nucleotide exchange factor [Rasamsonia emersonii CBS 393.64]
MEVMGKETEEEEVHVCQDSTLRMNPPALNKEGSFNVENTTTPAGAGTNYPFKKWMDSFRSKKRVSRIPEVYVEGWFDEPSTVTNDTEISTSPPLQDQQWDRLSGGSSSILGTVKTASMSLATQSFATRSRANTHSSHQSASQSDNLSGFEMRRSGESVRRTTSSMENAVRSRAGRRRHVLHEIFISESNYVDGLQTLSKRLLQMHENFKERLQLVTPLSVESPPAEISTLHGLQEKLRDLPRFKKSPSQSLRTRNLKATIDSRLKRATAEPSEALKVAQELEKLSEGFGAYEDFCSKYDLLYEDMDLLRKSVPAGGFWFHGIEALAKSVESTDSRKQGNKKSMTIEDLLIKPVQRVCKYQLLLQELLKTTPASDCPSTHYEIRQILDKVRRIVGQINTATGNPVLKDRIHKTVILHGRLDYSGQSVLHDVYQQLGPLNLCGVLHVAYKSTDRITGEYMICILFPSYLVLARGGYENRKLSVVASLYVLDMTVDILSNGQGLVCHDAPYSWKIIFQDDQNRYELILSASSATEERHWKTELLRASAMSPSALPTLSLEPRGLFLLSLSLVPLGRIDSPLAVLARRPSTRSMSTRSSVKRHLERVIIKKTHNPLHDEDVRQLHEGGIQRSRSVARENSPTVLAPLRQDRVRLERSIADIFTRDVLPYPGMLVTRADYLRTQSLMRGLSFRTPFNSRRSSSISKGTVKSIEAGSDTKDEDDLFDKEAVPCYPLREVVCLGEEPGADKGASDRSPETMRHAPTKAFQSMRHVMRASSDFIAYRTSDTKLRSKRRSIPWKRWTSPLAFFSSLSPSRRSSARDSSEG